MAEARSHLLIVCCHGIWLGGPKNGWDESEWLIQDFQEGETTTFIEHIKAGVKILSEDRQAVLVFSGGPTRGETRISEAASYASLAAANSYFGFLMPPAGSDAALSSRILLDERALDSYHNVLCSLILFWRIHGAWPALVTIVSHAFKRERLVGHHCGAIGFPLHRVRFVGINPPCMDEAQRKSLPGPALEVPDNKAAAAMRGVKATVDDWAEDPHGVGEVLAGKRKRRNPWGVDQRLFLNDGERTGSGLKTELLEDGGEMLVDGALRPWLSDSSS